MRQSYYNLWQVYYEVCQVLQSVTGCYYKVRQVLQSGTVITKWVVTSVCEEGESGCEDWFVNVREMKRKKPSCGTNGLILFITSAKQNKAN